MLRRWPVPRSSGIASKSIRATVSFTNKEQIDKWITAYGEDSDFVRIRVYGIFPRVGEMEFFNAEDVQLAANREAALVLLIHLLLGSTSLATERTLLSSIRAKVVMHGPTNASGIQGYQLFSSPTRCSRPTSPPR